MRRPTPVIFWLCAALALAGCSALRPVPRPTPAPPLAVPTAWTGQGAQAAPTPLVQWWTRFGDPELSSLVARALEANTRIASARGALQQARALRKVANAALALSVNVSASAQRNKSGEQPVSGNSSGSLGASYEPDISGVRGAAVRAREADIEAAGATLGDVQVAVAAEVAANYISLRGAERRLAIARDNLANQRETAQLTDWRTRAGLLTSLENEQARAAAEQAAARLPALETAVLQLRHALAVLVASAPAALDAELAPGAARLPDPGPGVVLAIPAATLRQRPDVRAAEARVRAAYERVNEADAARYPTFRLDASLGLRGLEVGGSGGATLLKSLLGSISGEAFDAGAGYAQVLAQQGALVQAEAAWRAQVLQALGEVEDGLQALAADRVRAQALATAAEAAANAALLARQRYASGLADFQTVLETQRTLFTVQDDLAATRAALGTDHVQLYRALGGGWDGRVTEEVKK